MVFNATNLVTDLKDYVSSHLAYAEALKGKKEEFLQKKENPNKWSVLECLEHLNLYASFYNIEVKKRIELSNSKAKEVFKSGFIANKVILDLLPKEDMRTMQTFKSKNPIHTSLNKETVLNDFIRSQKELLVLLDKANEKDLSKIKTSLTIPFFKFRLGDTFRFVIYHNERHIMQARKVIR